MDINDEFDVFHAENPHIYDLFVKFAAHAKNSGHQHYSAKGIFERLRWHMNVETNSADGFKLNNNYTSRYARMLMEHDSTFRGFFRTRELSNQ